MGNILEVALCFSMFFEEARQLDLFECMDCNCYMEWNNIKAQMVMLAAQIQCTDCGLKAAALQIVRGCK